MASSGVDVDDNVVEEFQKIKLRKAYRYLTFKLSDDLKKIVVENKSEKEDPNARNTEADYKGFVDTLPENDCRYAICDFNYTDGNGAAQGKLAFVVWCPDSAPIKKKMLYASSKDALKKKLDPVIEVQGNDLSEVQYNEVLAVISKKK